MGLLHKEVYYFNTQLDAVLTEGGWEEGGGGGEDRRVCCIKRCITSTDS